MNSKDVVALVTGGASGLGEASITELVKKGARVVIVDIDSDKGEKLAANIGEGAIFVKTDVTSEADVRQAIQKAVDAFADKNDREKFYKFYKEVEALYEILSPSPELRDFINKHYHVVYKKAQVYNLLKRLGFTFQKGRVKYPEADEQKRGEFKELVKKTTRRTGRDSDIE